MAEFDDRRRRLQNACASTRHEGARTQLERMIAANLRTLTAMNSSLDLLRAESARETTPTL